MNRSRSLKQYERIGEGSGTTGNNNFLPEDSSRTYTPTSERIPSTAAYELQDYKQSPKFVPSFSNKLPRPSPAYAAVRSVDEDAGSQNLAHANVGPGSVNTGYSPLFTRRWVLGCFALLWALIIAALQVLYSVSQAEKGVATTRSSLRYLWAYGPTAFLVIITVLWRQVDYASKYVQPWAELAKGPLPARQTLLLDYITPFQIVAFWRALRFRHVTIAATVLIFVLIKVVTIVSTGLLTLEPIAFYDVPQAMRAVTSFDGSEGLPLDKVDARAATGLYGHRQYGMLLPNGTTTEYAFQLVEPATSVPKDTFAYNASVEVFVPSGWDCEIGDLTYVIGEAHNPVDSTGDWDITPTMMYYNTSISLSDCQIHHGHLDAPDWMYDTSANVTIEPRYGYWGTFQSVNCSNLQPSATKFNRYIISVAYSKGVGQGDNTMLNSSNVVCIPSYNLQQGYVSTFTNGSLTGAINLDSNGRQLEGVTADDITLAVYESVKQTSIPTKFSSDNLTADMFLNTMIALTPDFQVEMLMDNNWLTTKSREAYQQHAAQIAGLYLLKQDTTSSQIDGYLWRNEQRLVVKTLPTRLMQAFIAAMLVLTIMMIFTVPRNVVPRSIESVAAIAVILARSPSLAQILLNSGHLDIEQLRQVLVGHRYMSTVADGPEGRTFSIRVIAGSDTTATRPLPSRIKWVQPLVLRRVVMTLTMLLAVIILVALEVLFRESGAHNGIANVDPDSFRRYAWIYTPTVVLVLLATTFNVLDFELEFADPYHELARGYTKAEASVLWHPLRHISLKTCLQAIQRSRFALVASSISVVFAPMLTIVVSGLFDPRPVPFTQEVTAKTLTWFNSSSSDDYTVGAAAADFAIPALVLQSNMSYPQWTYDELAYPSIDLTSQTTGIARASGGSLALSVPAVRASVNCTVVPESKYYNLTYGGESYPTSVYYNLSTPDGCGTSGWIDGDMIYLGGSVEAPASGSGYFGDVIWGSDVATRETDNVTVPCPMYYLTYGKIEDTKLVAFSMYSCDCGLETVQTNANISLDLATVVNVSHVEENSTKPFQERWYLDTVAPPYFSPINFSHPDESFDSFTNVMVYGQDGIPRDQLLDQKTYVTQFTHTYRQWIAQWASSHMRNPVNELAKNESNIAGTLPDALSGTYDDPNRQRLFLTEVSTRILQAIIAILLTCGAVIFLLVDMSKVLPKPVGTIAAVASLLAGSRLIDEKSGLIPHGSEWLSDTEMKKRGMWEGEKFRMGWWDDDDSADIDGLDTTYDGGAVGLRGGALAKETGHFRIDARPSNVGDLKNGLK
ncbi:hypothetical protein PMZ80_002349 [Knufia obscura]|uniref:Uncharacterized protein n=2 Tax=Knufia TaxID=430999 RepID=A0AAN8I5Q9_9EURO|nr:hypothetical protein PMZ80_002349 [Knufia obscura]KAK5950706.1 hypothetical protein OHC33_008373 [Knufia fluminis]